MTQANHPLCSDAQSNPWLVSPQSAGVPVIQRYGGNELERRL